jgi:hypothetical protein
LSSIGEPSSNNKQKPNKHQTKNITVQTNKQQICVFNMASASDGVTRVRECVMRIAKPNGFAEVEMSLEKEIARNLHKLTGANARQVENANDETSSSDLGTLLRWVAETSTHEVEVLINELHGLRKTLVSDGIRIQSDIERYAELSQGVMQLAAIISDSVKQIPGSPSIST